MDIKLIIILIFCAPALFVLSCYLLICFVLIVLEIMAFLDKVFNKNN